MLGRGRTGVFVCGLLPNSAAMDCGKISIGDQIIEVNGIDMRQATVDEAADIMVRMLYVRACVFLCVCVCVCVCVHVCI